MIVKTASIFRRLARASFVVGTLCLILGLVLSFLNVPASASTDSTDILDQRLDYQPNACILGFKCEQPGCEPDPYSSWTAQAGYRICEIAIKAGSHYLQFTSDGCAEVNGDGQADYCVGGIGGGTGYAERRCVENGQEQCYAISHSEFYIDTLPPPPTPTNTNTSIPPSQTPTDTSIAPSPTPTDTSIPPSPTPTDMDVPPTPTSTNTSVLPTLTPTNTSPPPTSTSTNTPIPSTSTPTGTPTSTSTPTGTPIAATTTPTVTGTQPTATMTDTPAPATATPTFSATSTQTSTATSTQLATATDTSTSAPTVTQTQPPTLPPPPQTTTTPALIPVTGADLTGLSDHVSVFARLLINLGMGMIGLALVFYGLGKRLGNL